MLGLINSTLQSLYRTQIIGWASVVNQDIRKARMINRAMLENLSEPELFQRESVEEADRIRFKPLSIHRYFPPDGLDGALGFLDVRRPRLERLIELCRAVPEAVIVLLVPAGLHHEVARTVLERFEPLEPMLYIRLHVGAGPLHGDLGVPGHRQGDGNGLHGDHQPAPGP